MALFHTLLAATNGIQAEEPTLARLAFWVPPGQMESFREAYTSLVSPVLDRHGIPEHTGAARATQDSVFSRLLRLNTAGELVAWEEALAGDTRWREALGACRKTPQIGVPFWVWIS